jgi:NADPH-dependent curcumin reductase
VSEATQAPPAQANRQFLLAERPQGVPTADTFTLTSGAVPEPRESEVVVKTLYLSLDPAMRMWMNEGRSYIEPVAVGEVMRAIGLGQVTGSRHPGLAEGDYVTGLLGAQQFATLPGDQLNKIDPELAPLPVHLSALGMTGMSAYFGLLDVGQPNEGETVVVSAAAGAVGSVAGQIAKIKGCRVIGIAGGPHKCRFVTDELGFDAAIDYKSENVAERLQELCPERVDVYFDNVGGEVLDAVLANLAGGARVVISGAISQYNSAQPKGPANYMALAVDRARMQGFIVTDYVPRFGEAVRDISAWIADGRLRSDEQIVEGFDNFPAALLKLFDGQNRGKLILEVAKA